MSQAQIAAKEMAVQDAAPARSLKLFDSVLLVPAIIDSFRKLNPRTQLRSPVMFVVYVGSIITSLLYVQALFGQGEARPGFILATSIWLWFTVLFANFAEALAEGRSKAQAASLRSLKQTVMAKKLASPKHGTTWLPQIATELRKGHYILVEAGDVIPIDGEVIEGVASVDESAITGESAPVIRESGGDFSSVTGGTRVLSDWLVVKVTVNPGETFLDRMIAMVEGAKRQKTPNEIALTILLVALTIVFLIVTVTLLPFSLFSVEAATATNNSSAPITITVLIALLVCLIPTTIGGLLSAIGVAGMSRMMQANVIATSGRAVEAAGDVDVLLLDKTGTITLGNRQASAFVAAPGQSYPPEVARAVDDVSRRGSTPLVVVDEGRVMGVVELKDIVKGGIKERFAELRRMGIKTVMITGDNKLTAAAIAAEAGVDDFLAEATPEDKLKLIRSYQAEGRLVAMTGDGTNDAPALAQADVAVAMNSGTQAAKEAGNMVDLDSNPTKLLEIVEIGKQMLMTRGSLTTFSISNDIAKYFAIIPAAFVGTYPQLKALDIMHLASPSSAIMSAVIFNALIIVVLIPLALKGVQYRAIGAASLLRRNLLVYGVGGIILPFIGIKLIDMLLAAFNFV